MPLRLLGRLALVIPLLAITLTGAILPAAAQDDGESGVLIDVTLDAGDYPVAPAFVRLLRITLEPNASSPLHTHPGPEIALVERGTLTVQVNGPAELDVADQDPGDGTPASGQLAPAGSEFEMTAGDQLAYLPQTPMTFRNAGSEPVSILSVVLLPAGHQHPPGITYLNGQPATDAFDGVTPQILGDGVASAMPANGIRIVVDELSLDQGAPIPASSSQTLLSLQQGGLDFTVIGGKAQVSRGATPGPQSDTPPGTENNLAVNDALFFPLGNKEAARPETDAPISFLRMTISPASPQSEPTPTGEGQAELHVTGTEITPTPAPGTGTPVSAATSTPEAQASPTATPPTGPQEGDSIVVNSEGVNLRACGSTDCEIVTQLYFGQTVTILGQSEDDGEYIWWPVSVDDDPSITGYVVQDFLDLPESGE
ncbi:MAG: SH3 domain-containing protein [Thermomicrobiales bacterium]|nr:SH3 domain-containing protein [Thermomicrobiales bacterium]MCO5220970.1 SH3 domain-containing protein [Thermomicrobiales bacterium]